MGVKEYFELKPRRHLQNQSLDLYAHKVLKASKLKKMETNRAAQKSVLCEAICFLTSYLEHVICCLFFFPDPTPFLPPFVYKLFFSCRIGLLKSQWSADVFYTAKFCSYTENSLKQDCSQKQKTFQGFNSNKCKSAYFCILTQLMLTGDCTY